MTVLYSFNLQEIGILILIRNTIILLAALITTSTANGIVIRHDVEDKKYVALGNEYSGSVAYIAGCAATLIDKNWLLTAAHCVEGKEEEVFSARHDDYIYRVENIFIHPRFNRINDEVFDAALVQLKDPIAHGKPAIPNRKRNEVGQQVIFVGRGTFGNGRDGLIRDDAKQRGATNTVASANENVLEFIFNSPGKATKYEGISSRGDSGGPAFLIVNNKPVVIGISSYQDGHGFAEGHYGVGEYYTRVSSIYSWLQSVINNAKPALPPSHPVINAIVDNDLEALNNAVTESVLHKKEIITEAFYQSVMLNRVELARSLIKYGANFEDVRINNDSLFAFALAMKRKEYFQMLLDLATNSKKIHDSNSIVLPLFISNFRKEAYLLNGAKLLIDQGANLDIQTMAGDTALIIAGWSTNNFELVKLLVSNGADVNIANNNGDTPLIDAAYLGKLENLRYLLANGADVSLKNNQGKTAFDVAKSSEITAELSRSH